MAGQEWHYETSGKRHGPVASQQLKKLAASGQLSPNDLVWREGMPDWKPASTVKGLSQSLDAQSQVQSTPKRSSSAISPPSSNIDETGQTAVASFYSYVTTHWGQSHGHWFLPVFFAFLAAPILSFLKPAIGFNGQLYFVIGLASLTSIFFVVYCIQRICSYYLGKERIVSDEATSKLAAGAYVGAVALCFPLGPLVAIESVASDRGIVARYLPVVAEQQTILLATLNLVDSDEASDVADTPDNAIDNDRDEDSSDGSQSKSNRNRSTASVNATSNASVNATSNPAEVVVIAEGTGLDSDQALKDAFRNAVRQVVGAVIDADTLIENDEVISDRVLTYSDGFIPKWDIVSESHTDGLFQKRIKATVKRRSVIAKLEAANVTVRAVDGKSLFAEAITQLEGKRNATSILKHALVDLPTLLTARVEKKTEYDRDKSEIIVELLIEVDHEAYAAFAARLENVLRKISIDNTSTLVKAAQGGRNGFQGLFASENHTELIGPKLDAKRGTSCVWVCSFTDGSHTTTRWNGYVVDADLSKAAGRLQMPSWHSHFKRRTGPESKTLVTISAMDSAGAVVTEGEYELLCDHDSTYHYGSSADGPLPLLRHMIRRTFDGQYSVTHSTGKHYPEETDNLYVSPHSFTIKKTGYGIGLYYRTEVRMTRRLSVPLDELKRIQDIRCKLGFQL